MLIIAIILYVDPRMLHISYQYFVPMVTCHAPYCSGATISFSSDGQMIIESAGSVSVCVMLVSAEGGLLRSVPYKISASKLRIHKRPPLQYIYRQLSLRHFLAFNSVLGIELNCVPRTYVNTLLAIYKIIMHYNYRNFDTILLALN